MALVTAYNGAVAAGKTVQVGAQALTAPFRGVELQMAQTMAAVAPWGCRVAYAISQDGGSTYSDFQPVGHEPNPSISGATSHASVLINEFATNIKFQIANADAAVACTTFVLQMFTFS